MLHSLEITSVGTIISVTPLPPSPSQGDDTSLSSYVIGPIDPAQLVKMQAQLSTGDECSLLIPASLPHAILTHPAFRDSYEWNYLSEEEGDEEDEEWTTSVPRLLNHIHSHLTDARWFRDLATGQVDLDMLPWQVGWLLRDLTRLAETDTPLAHVGFAHLCFLLSFFTTHHPSDWSYQGAHHVHSQHTRAIKAYRERVRFYRQLGNDFEQAQQLALC